MYPARTGEQVSKGHRTVTAWGHMTVRVRPGRRAVRAAVRETSHPSSSVASGRPSSRRRRVHRGPKNNTRAPRRLVRGVRVLLDDGQHRLECRLRAPDRGPARVAGLERAHEPGDGVLEPVALPLPRGAHLVPRRPCREFEAILVEVRPGADLLDAVRQQLGGLPDPRGDRAGSANVIHGARMPCRGGLAATRAAPGCSRSL